MDEYIYPGFNVENLTLRTHDIALIKLNKPINTSANGLFAIENNICLPPKRESPALESYPEYAMTAGWGDEAIQNSRLQIMYLKIDFQTKHSVPNLGANIVYTLKLDDQRFCSVSFIH